jgi:radical SAM superfamily enzyme YgiQ (UPF0313 family)
MKITLLNPPLTDKQQSGDLGNVANVILPLGLGYIGAILKKNNFEVEVIDCPALKSGTEETIHKIIETHPDLIGITATCLSFHNAVNCATKLKEKQPDIPVILGGPHLTTIPGEAMDFKCFDFGVLGEGEETMLELAGKIRNKENNFSDIKGIAYRAGNKVLLTPKRDYIKDLDNIPFPSRELFPPLSRYRPSPVAYKYLPVGHLITSRGCPYQCAFCDRKVFGNLCRFRTPENVIKEIEELIYMCGARELKFFDDTFTLKKDHAIRICELMMERRFDVSWSCLTRVDHITEELLQIMKKAGCWQIVFGFESGDDKMLKKMKKGFNTAQVKDAVKLCKKLGFNVRGSFVLGYPGETRQTIKKTITFAKRIDIDAVIFCVITPYPGSEVFEIAKRSGTLLHKDYRFYQEAVNSKTGRLAYIPEGFTEKELLKAVVKAHKAFYCGPKFILKQLREIKSPAILKKKLKGLRTLLKWR